jgi:tetratricopeptide (TPR) repeat protein
MKSKKQEIRKQKPAVLESKPSLWWAYAAAALSAVILAFWAYGPSLHGPFLFDDTVLPFALPNFAAPLSVWVRGVRPLLMASYWVNAQISGEDTYSYHVVNVLIHLLATGFVFLIIRRLLEWARVESSRNLLAAFAAAIFLLHPLQTESVAYLAGRSEAASDMLVFAAYTVFIYRKKTAITWPAVAGVLLLFGAAVLTKEHTVVFPALLLLTDYWWNPGFSFQGIKRNWKIYAPVVLGALGGVLLFRDLILHAPTAGFGMKDFTWYQYFFTQCRALFVYPALFLLPAGLRVDWDFPVSYSILDHGAIFGLLALIALAAAAWWYRRGFPLAAFGFFAYLLLMAPTSSVLPIRDPVAERRIYLAMPGLLLILVDVLSRLRIERKVLATACVVVALVAAVTTRAHAAVWSDAVALWEDTVQKSPNKARVHFQLASAYYSQGRCDPAQNEFARTARLMTPDYNLLVDWALAYDCLNQPDQAMAKLQQAAALEQTGHVYSQMGMVYAKRSRWAEALDVLAKAQKIDPNFAMTYVYQCGVHISLNQPAQAIPECQHALALDPTLEQPRQYIAMAQARLRGGR